MDYLEIEEKVAKMDITLPPPEPEADRQYYFIRKLQLWMEEKKKESGRPLTACITTFGSDECTGFRKDYRYHGNDRI